MSERTTIPIVAGDENVKYSLAKFNTGYEVDLSKIDSEWYIQTKPEEKEEEVETKKRPIKKYPDRPVVDKTWWMHSNSGRYFRETLDDTENSQFIFLLKKQDKFEAYPIHQHHTFRPIPKPKSAQTEEQRQKLASLAKMNKLQQAKGEARFKSAIEHSVLSENQKKKKNFLVEEGKPEGMDYDEVISDDEGVEITTEGGKALNAEMKKVLEEKESDDEDEEEDSKASIQNVNSILGKRSTFPGELETPPLKKIKVGTELTKENLISLLRNDGPLSLRDIRKHFRKSGTTEERKDFIKTHIPEIAYINEDKKFGLKPEFAKQ